MYVNKPWAPAKPEELLSRLLLSDADWAVACDVSYPIGRAKARFPNEGLPNDGLPYDGLPYDGLPIAGLPKAGLPC